MMSPIECDIFLLYRESHQRDALLTPLSVHCCSHLNGSIMSLFLSRSPSPPSPVGGTLLPMYRFSERLKRNADAMPQPLIVRLQNLSPCHMKAQPVSDGPRANASTVTRYYQSAISGCIRCRSYEARLLPPVWASFQVSAAVHAPRVRTSMYGRGYFSPLSHCGARRAARESSHYTR